MKLTVQEIEDSRELAEKLATLEAQLAFESSEVMRLQGNLAEERGRLAVAVEALASYANGNIDLGVVAREALAKLRAAKEGR